MNKDTRRLCIRNAIVITPEQTIPDGMVLVEAGRIRYTGKGEGIDLGEAEIVDARGMLLAPGFIDLQLNGGFGSDFTQEPGGIWKVAAELPRYGVTAFLPTIITSPANRVEQAQDVLHAGAPAGWQGAVPYGLHLEGPMLNPGKKGAHNPAYIQPPSLEVIEGWSASANVRLVTLAPEVPGALDVVTTLRERGVIVSAGHSLANFAQARAGFAAGISMVTHLFNAMPPLDHREPGLAGAALQDEHVAVGIIPDGVHVHPTMLNLVWKAKGKSGVVIVTDSMAAMGMPPGKYHLADYDVIVDEHSARLADQTLAGSIVTMDAAVRNMAAWCGLALTEAVRAASQTPAYVLGLAHKGRISPGADADLVLLTPEGHVLRTYVGGNLVYRA